MFERPSLSTIVDRILSDIKSRIDGASTFLRRSTIKVLGTVFGGASHLLYGFIDYMANQLFLTTADSEYVDLHANEFGLVRKASVKSTGTATATGTIGKTIPAGSEIISDAGVSYVTDEIATFITTSVSIIFTAVLAGADGNDDPDITLSFVSPITGVDTEVTVDSTGIINGLDEETAEELRERALTRKRQSPYGGADFDYEEWAKEVAGVTRAWAFANWQGSNTVGLAFVRDNDEVIIPTEDQREEVKEYIEEHTNVLTGVTIGKPTGATLYMITLSEYTQDFSISITPNNAAVKASILTQLTDYINTLGPGVSNYRAGMNKSVGAATGLTAFSIDTPAADVGYNTDNVPVMGTITWSDYQ